MMNCYQQFGPSGGTDIGTAVQSIPTLVIVFDTVRGITAGGEDAMLLKID
jgi:N-acetylmuramic acid 6-phosphate (MurNAc-6-P) etherase